MSVVLGALTGLRVIELGEYISGPYCGKLLADLGADVIKIEIGRHGDPLRNRGSFPDDDVDPTVGALFQYLNTNKQSIACDLDSDIGWKRFLSAVGEADVVIENLGFHALESRGLGFQQISEVNPQVVLIRISDFGQEGPYAARPATDLTVQAAGNWVNNHHIPGQKPVQVGGGIADYVTGEFAANAALTGVRQAQASGKAVCVDLSKQECLVSCLGVPWLHIETLQALGWGMPEERFFPFPGVVRCKDGLVSINSLTHQHFADCCSLMGVPEYISRLQEIAYPGEGFDRFFHDIDPWLQERTVDEIVELCQTIRIPAVPICDGQSLRSLEQLNARPFFIKDPETGMEFPGFPYRLDRTPATLRQSAPTLGKCAVGGNGEIWQQQPLNLKQTARGIDALPYSGLRVLDLGIFMAGPIVSCYLGSYGADVVKIESIQRPDSFRYQCAYPEEGPDWYERSSIWQHMNLNKRDLTLNLDDARGKELFARLVADADVLIENFAPRVLENFGFGARRLREINPRLIAVRMPGFGLEGPWKEYTSFAMPLEQVSGMASVTGERDGMPLNLGGYADVVVGMHALVALQAALIERDRSGQGQLIEVAQLEAGVSVTAEQLIAYALAKRNIGRKGNRNDVMAPQGVYRCADGRSVAISIRGDADWAAFAGIDTVHTWAGADRFKTREQRQNTHDELDDLILKWVGELHADEVVSTLIARGIPASLVVTQSDIPYEQSLVARDFLQKIDHPLSGIRKQPRWPWMASGGMSSLHRFRAPTLGEHNEEILSGELKLSQGELEALSGSGVIGTVPRGLQ